MLTLPKLRARMNSFVHCIALSADGAWVLAVAGALREAWWADRHAGEWHPLLWPVEGASYFMPAQGPADTAHQAAAHPSGEPAVAWDTLTWTWSADAAGPPPAHEFRLPSHRRVGGARITLDRGACVTTSPDGTRIVAIGCRSAYLEVWADDGASLFRLVPAKGPKFVAPAFTPDNRTLYTGFDHGVRRFDVATGAEAGGFDWRAGMVTAVTVASDGLTAAAGTATGRVVIWDIDD